MSNVVSITKNKVVDLPVNLKMVLTIEEVNKLLENLEKEADGKEVTKEQLIALCTWAANVRIGMVTLESVLSGHIAVSFVDNVEPDEDSIMFRDTLQQVTPQEAG